jgi:hypothetical protein
VTEATDPEMCGAVEQWARARGWWNEQNTAVPLLTEPWSIQWRDESMLVHTVKHARGRLIEEWHASPHAALVWALVLEARPLRDGSSCKRCDGCGRTRPAEMALERATSLPGGGLSVPVKSWTPARDPSDRFSGRCSACEGTGLADLTDAHAQHVLDAQPRQQGNPAVYTWTKPGNPASVEALHMLADMLQDWVCSKCDRPSEPRGSCRHCGGSLAPSPHQALGLHLAHLLAGKHERTADAVELLLLSPYVLLAERERERGIVPVDGQTLDERRASVLAKMR